MPLERRTDSHTMPAGDAPARVVAAVLFKVCCSRLTAPRMLPASLGGAIASEFEGCKESLSRPLDRRWRGCARVWVAAMVEERC